MRGCRRACLLQLAMWFALIAAIGVWLRSQCDAGEKVWGFAAGSGLLAAMSILLVHSVWVAIRERRLLQTAASGQPLEDGAWSVVCGAIRASVPVRSPLTAQDVVAYEYNVHRYVRSGRNSNDVTYFDGKALAKSMIASPSGAVRLLAVPNVEAENESIDKAKAIHNLTAHFRTTTFAPRKTGSQRTAALHAEWTDDDGSFRIDRKHTEETDLTDALSYHERVIRQGDSVCVFGVWSATRGGIVPDSKWGRPVRLMRGDASSALRSLSGRVVRYTIAAIVFAAGAAGIVWVYLDSGCPPG